MLENEEFHLYTDILKKGRILSKVGEIFHVESYIFKLQCNDCLSEFFDFFQFVAHIEIHLARTENVNFDDHVDTQIVSIQEKSEHSCEQNIDDVNVDDECEIKEQLILEIKAKPIDVWSPDRSDEPIECETEFEPEQLPRTRTHLCHRCSRNYRRKFSLIRHLKSCLNKTAKFKCVKCGCKFRRKDLLQRHMRQTCPKRQTNVSGSKNSLRKVTITNLPKKLILQSTKKSIQNKTECLRLSCLSSNGEYKCSICLQIYQRKFSLKRHIDQHFLPYFNCLKCNAKFRRKDVLQRHMKKSCKEQKDMCKCKKK